VFGDSIPFFSRSADFKGISLSQGVGSYKNIYLERNLSGSSHSDLATFFREAGGGKKRTNCRFGNDGDVSCTKLKGHLVGSL